MILENLKIFNLRNHNETELDFNKKLNVLHGLNGSGKTTVLEAISICGFSKSFLPSADKALINHDCSYYSISAKSRSALDVPYKVNVHYEAGSKKKISSSVGDNLSPKDIIGEMPLVILSPDYKSITFGTPQDRRSFIDRLLSQASKKYYLLLIKLRRALKQRNNLLGKVKAGINVDNSLIEPWTNIIINTGTEIICRRNDFVNDFVPYFQELYKKISDSKENVSIVYDPHDIKSNKIQEINPDLVRTQIHEYFRSVESIEYRRGTTMFGPQKDDIKIYINSGLARDAASQGQHKSLLISIKFAEFYYLKSIRNEVPIILLDDIFAELDSKRAQNVFELLNSSSAQTFITVTDPALVKNVINTPDVNYYYAENGTIK